MLETNYQITFHSELAVDEKVIAGVKSVQDSFKWGDANFRTAQKRLSVATNPKIFVIEKATRELLAYAVLFPEDGGWYLSQIAVTLDLQGKGIGKAIMSKIFEEAVKYNISTITLDVRGNDEKKLKFYQNVASGTTTVKKIHDGEYNNHDPKIKFEYKLKK